MMNVQYLSALLSLDLKYIFYIFLNVTMREMLLPNVLQISTVQKQEHCGSDQVKVLLHCSYICFITES